MLAAKARVPPLTPSEEGGDSAKGRGGSKSGARASARGAEGCLRAGGPSGGYLCGMRRGMVLVVAAFVLASCGGGSKSVEQAPPCGWDLRTEAGRQDMREFNAWMEANYGLDVIMANPGMTRPIVTPNSPYFLGDCVTNNDPYAPYDMDLDAGVPADADAGYNDSYQWGD